MVVFFKKYGIIDFFFVFGMLTFRDSFFNGVFAMFFIFVDKGNESKVLFCILRIK